MDESDSDFLWYVDLHSRTPRALFSREMVDRFLRLAGEDPDTYALGNATFIAMHHDRIGGLLAEARKRISDAT